MRRDAVEADDDLLERVPVRPVLDEGVKLGDLLDVRVDRDRLVLGAVGRGHKPAEVFPFLAHGRSPQ
jgi:hypothetical protein